MIGGWLPVGVRAGYLVGVRARYNYEACEARNEDLKSCFKSIGVSFVFPFLDKVLEKDTLCKKVFFF